METITQNRVKIRPRGGSVSQWAGKNPVLLERELGLEYPDTGITDGHIKFKIGDGVHAWNDLPYCSIETTEANMIIGGAPDNDTLISIKCGTTAQWSVNNPILQEGEMGYDSTLGEIKVGDGIHRFSDLRYVGQTWESNKIYDFGNYDAPENP